ncbi:tetratricopeptide repeat-containing sensor histidine kinase [Croceitalea sp. P059]|uniref:tetratricopeptide repeat-containing sensor histidine kinase n=1 Tax=Croceitalea sp. P059 TaxID=3075601 RepID=UPI002887F970|nr:tetratricopeptide repeat-containing sensor histidine kinase [Croceitalea sp. P059]MDT0539516.1 tetratricopeptide repeat-containing sensor histidine kinase [Croceitalea sp. P059]
MCTYNKQTLKPYKVNSIILILFMLCVPIMYGQQSSIDSIKRKIVKLQKKTPNFEKDTSYINLINNLAGNYRFIKSDSLLFLSKEALALSKQLNYIHGETKALNSLGDYFSDKGNALKAISYLNNALKIADSVQDLKLKLALLNDLGTEYSYTGDYEKALNSYLEGIDIATPLDDKLMLSILNENIAALYAAQKEFSQALEFYKKVKRYNEQLGDEIISAETMSNLAELYTDMDNFEYAMFNINQSISIFEKHGIYDWLAFAYSVKGGIYLNQKKYKWSLYWFDQSNVLHENLEDDRSKIELLNGLAKAYYGLNIDSTSSKFAQEGFEISKRIQSLQGQKDCAETLYKISKNNDEYENALAFHEVFQKLSDSLSRDENKKILTLTKTRFNYDQQKQELIEANEKALAKQRNLINLALAILCIVLAISIPLYFNQKKQKRLYKELKVKTKSLRERESELNEINKTKDKLFSIIGHDLRGPIGALQGILKLFSSGDIAKEEFHSFVPKLKSDVDHILFTLNNLLSWGYAQMNGTTTRPKVNCFSKLVDNNINLLSELAASKSIKIINQLPENPMGYFDQNHIDIVVRNLVSNAIKFTPNNGLITIEAVEDKNSWKISVRDTGIGMDKPTMKKIFNDNSNLTTYGTNNEKGTGLGLNLCKEMVIKNKGEIWVESELQKGSTFYFTIPKVVKKYKKAG